MRKKSTMTIALPALIFTYLILLFLYVPTVTAQSKVPAGKTFQWRLFNHGPILYNDYFRTRLAPGIERASNGRLKITVLYPGDHPYKPADLLGALKEGSCQMAQFSYGNVGGSEPRLSIQDIPFLEPPGDVLVKRKFHHALDTFRANVLKEWNAREVLACFDGPQQLWLDDGWVEGPNSLGGKKIRVFTTDLENAITLMGGIPARIDYGEVYTSLQTKLIRGLVTGAGGAYIGKFVEIVKHMVPVSFFQSTNAVLVNTKAWNELPTDLQDAVSAYLDSERETFETTFAMSDGLYLNSAFLKYRLEVKPPPETFMVEVRKQAPAKIWDKWAERAGPKGKQALDQVLEVAKTIK